MYRLFQQFLRIALLKGTPQELPGQQVVMWIGIAAAFTTACGGMLFEYSFTESVLRSGLALLITAALMLVMLRLKRLQHRFHQSFAALCGASAVIYLLALPLMPLFFTANVDTTSGKLLVIVVLMLDLWALVVTAHVFKHTFAVSFATGISVAIAFTLIAIVLLESVVPSSRPITEDVSARSFLEVPRPTVVV